MLLFGLACWFNRTLVVLLNFAIDIISHFNGTLLMGDKKCNFFISLKWGIIKGIFVEWKIFTKIKIADNLYPPVNICSRHTRISVVQMSWYFWIKSFLYIPIEVKFADDYWAVKFVAVTWRCWKFRKNYEKTFTSGGSLYNKAVDCRTLTFK